MVCTLLHSRDTCYRVSISDIDGIGFSDSDGISGSGSDSNSDRGDRDTSTLMQVSRCCLTMLALMLYLH